MTTRLEDLPAMVLPPAVLEGASVAEWVLDDLAEVELGDLTSEQIGDAVARWHRVAARVDALKLRLLAAAGSAGTARSAGAASTGAWAARLTRDDAADAARQSDLAERLQRSHAPTRVALGQGRLTRKHAEVIVDAARRLPARLTPQQRTTVEESLVAKADTLSPQALRRAARRALEAAESDLTKVDQHENTLVHDEEEGALAKARLTLHDNGDGTVTGHFTVPELHGHLLRKILETMTAPRRGHLGASQAQAGERGVHGDWAHARGIAFCELVEHLPTDHLHGKVAPPWW
jgi:hypothetical protein